MTHTIRECLDAIGVETAQLEACGSLQEQFSAIKRSYFNQILSCHPDKGGDAAVFRKVQTSFEVLRESYSKNSIISFVVNVDQVVDDYDETYQDFGDMPTPSWDYYYEAAEEEVPLYKVELAKSARSACVKCKSKNNKKNKPEDYVERDEKIEKGAVRVGSLHEDTGTYTRWNHLKCWRVPSRVWLGLPDPETCTDPLKFEHALLGMNEMLFTGLEELNEQDKDAVVAFVMNKEHWARLQKRRQPKKDTANAAVMEQKEKGKAKAVVTTDFHTKKREVFVVPVPGKNGVEPDMLKGKRVVLTGVFPEVGGGRGLSLGKDKVKAMVENFGGRVTGSISGKTDILVVGKDPGYSKVSKARAQGIEMLTLKDLKDKLEGRLLEGEERPMVITNFSSGYGGNSLAATAPPEALAIAAGTKKAPPKLTKTAAKRAASAKAGPPKKKVALNPDAKAFVPGGIVGKQAASTSSVEKDADHASKSPPKAPMQTEAQTKKAATADKAKGPSSEPAATQGASSRELVAKDDSQPKLRRSNRRRLKKPLAVTDNTAQKPPAKKAAKKKKGSNAGAENKPPSKNAKKKQPKKKPAKKAAAAKKAKGN